MAEGESAAPAAPAAAAAAPAAVAGNATAGKGKNAMCQGCHGQPGWRTAFPEVYTVPKLGGQNPNYLVAALKEYKTGERAHPTMQAIAAGLSEQDMVDLAAYYAAAAK
ncbi:MAG: cytochrome c [Pseudomonadota bacterium]|nr:cytochrome c [Pseudomonadota bacterium]